MAIEKDKILKNYQKYIETGQKYGFIPEDLITFLGTKFIEAPASTMKGMNNAFDGGLIDHLLRVTKFAISTNDSLPDTLKVNRETLIKVCLLHQIGKAHMFTKLNSFGSKQFKLYDFVENSLPLKVGELSILILMNYGVTLTEEEYAAIITFDRADDDKQVKFFNTMLGELLKVANVFAIKEEKMLYNNG